MDKMTVEVDNYPPRSVAYYLIAVLMLVTLSSQLDRNITSLLVDPISQELGLDDVQMSIIHGLGFAIVYSLAGLPFGYLVDRTNRRRIILVGLLFWSVSAVLCGFAQNFWQLLIARLGVGVGEACLAPAAYSMIADSVPNKIRGRALAVYYSSLTIGQGLSLVIGGLILASLPPIVKFPVINLDLEEWRVVFIAVGLPGILLSLLVLTIREPKRIVTAYDMELADRGLNISEFLRFVGARGKLFFLLLFPYCVIGFVAWGMSAWAPTLLHRRFGTDLAEVGQLVGVSALTAGLAGAYMGGYLSDRIASWDRFGSRYGVCLISAIVMLPFAAIWPFGSSIWTVLAGFWITIFAAIVSLSGAAAAIQDVVPNRMRGQAIALYMLTAGILALGLGPTVVALATKFIFSGPNSLAAALVLVALPSLAAVSIVSLYGLRHYVEARNNLLT